MSINLNANTWLPKDITAKIEQVQNGTLSTIKPTVGALTDGTPLFYAQAVNGVAGVAGVGKSYLAALLAKQHIHAGGLVIYVDWEANEDPLLLRLYDMGADLDQLKEGLRYVQPETMFADGGSALLDYLAGYRDALVIIDTAGEALAADNLNGNEDKDVAGWFQKFPTAAARLGHCVVVVDHLPKNPDNQGAPIGSQRKQAAITGVQYILKPGQAFSRVQDGYATVQVVKDRHGNFTRGDTIARLEIEDAGTSVCLTPEANTGDAFKPTVLMDRVIKFLESQPDQTAGSMTAITDSVSGKASYVRQAVRALIGEGLVVESAGSTRGTKYTLKDSVSANPSRPPYRGGTDRTDSIATRGRIGTDWDGLERNADRPAGLQDSAGDGLGRIGTDSPKNRGRIRPNPTRKETVKSDPKYADEDQWQDCAQCHDPKPVETLDRGLCTKCVSKAVTR